MKSLMAGGLMLTLAFVLQVNGQDTKKKFQGKGGFQGGGFGGGDLVSAKTIEKLELSASVKEKVEKINADYKEAAKSTREKTTEAFKSKDKEKIAEAMKASGAVRTEYLDKVKALLTDTQKKTLDDSRRGFGNFGGGAPGAGGAGSGSILSNFAKEKLNLSEEQKKKIDDLQKDTDSKLNGILNEEQRKQLEDLRKPRTDGKKKVA